VELTRPWSYQDFREALLEDFVREVVLPCAAEAAEVERQLEWYGTRYRTTGIELLPCPSCFDI